MTIKNSKVSHVKPKPAGSKAIKTPGVKTNKTKATSSGKVDTIRINANLEKALHEKVKKFATKNQLSLNQLINQAIKEYIKKLKTN
jgi:predicted HicB family RNase H-like nuclease